MQLYETYQNSQRSYLVLELAARGDLLEHINAMSDLRCCPGLEEEEARRLFWQLVSAVAHCHNAGIVHRCGRHLAYLPAWVAADLLEPSPTFPSPQGFKM